MKAIITYLAGNSGNWIGTSNYSRQCEPVLFAWAR